MAEYSPNKMAQSIADKVMKVEYNGKTLKEWIDLIAGGELKPVVNGKWKYQAQPVTSMRSDMIVTCLVCGHTRSRYDGEILNFCPKCGADMRGDTDENS